MTITASARNVWTVLPRYMEGPVQTHGVDCGVFMCGVADAFAEERVRVVHVCAR